MLRFGKMLWGKVENDETESETSSQRILGDLGWGPGAFMEQ